MEKWGRKRERESLEKVRGEKKNIVEGDKLSKLFRKRNSRVGVERDVLDAQRREHQQGAPAEEPGLVAADDAVGESDVASAVSSLFFFEFFF